MLYNKIKNTFINNIMLLFCLSCFFITHTVANNPDEAGDNSWKAKVFLPIDNILSINILDFDNKLEQNMAVYNPCINEDKVLSKIFTDGNYKYIQTS